MHHLITQDHVDTFQNDGVVLIRGLFDDYIDIIRQGIAQNLKNPGPYAAENLQSGESGRFFDDYCNWQRISEFEKVIRESAAAEVAASLMNSRGVQLFHDHVLIKEPGTAKSTPWHQDSPYYFVDGIQNVSFWVPLDHVGDATLRCVAGSHRWNIISIPTQKIISQYQTLTKKAWTFVSGQWSRGMRLHFHSQPCMGLAVTIPTLGDGPSHCDFWVMMLGMLNAPVLPLRHFLSMACAQGRGCEKTGFLFYSACSKSNQLCGVEIEAFSCRQDWEIRH